MKWRSLTWCAPSGKTQAARQALMESPKPSIIVKVDGFSEDMQSPEEARRDRR